MKGREYAREGASCCGGPIARRGSVPGMTAGGGASGVDAGRGRESLVAATTGTGAVASIVGLGATSVGGGVGGTTSSMSLLLGGGADGADDVSGVRGGITGSGSRAVVGRDVACSLSCVSLIVTSQRGPNMAHESMARKAVPIRASVRRPTMMPTMTCCNRGEEGGVSRRTPAAGVDDGDARR